MATDVASKFPEGGRQVLSGKEDSLGGTLHALGRAARKHAWLALSVACLVVFGAAAYGFSRTKIYRASAVLQLDPRPPTPLGQGVEGVVELGTGSYWSNVEYYNTQHKLMASKPIALAVVRELGLSQDLSFVANVSSGTAVPERTTSVKDGVAAAILLSRMNVNPIKESRLVEVSFDDADKERATRVLESLLRAYVAHNMNKTMESTASAVDWLGEQLQHLRSELGESELALHQYKLDKQIASIGIDDQTSMLMNEMKQLGEARTNVQTRIQAAAARLTQLREIDPEDPQQIPQMELLQSSHLASLRTEYVASLAEKDSLLSGGKGENHPQVHAAEARVRSSRLALTTELKNIQSGAERELNALRQEEGGLTSLIKHAEKEALELNLMEIEYRRLKRTNDNNEKLYSLVLERSKEAGLTQMLRVNNIQTVTPPATGDVPVEPRLTLILAAAGFVGLGLGLGAAFMRERLDRTIKSPQDLESELGVAPLGLIPSVGASGPLQGSVAPQRRRRGRGPKEGPAVERLVQNEPTSGFSEALRGLRTNLLLMSPDRPYRRLLVTSPGPSEGKTTVACNLGIAMAQAGQRVLLVDCDLRRPRLHLAFESLQGRRSTLCESLIAPDTLDLATLGSDIKNLSVLVAGPMPPNPAELLHSDSFRRLMDTISSEYDLVIIDSPPLIVTDAAILSSRVDGVVLVVRAFQTDRAGAERALRSLRDVGANVVGAVVNAADNRKGGYGYGYGSYSSSAQAAAS